jgi:hypothetical protein
LDLALGFSVMAVAWRFSLACLCTYVLVLSFRYTPGVTIEECSTLIFIAVWARSQTLARAGLLHVFRFVCVCCCSCLTSDYNLVVVGSTLWRPSWFCAWGAVHAMPMIV